MGAIKSQNPKILADSQQSSSENQGIIPYTISCHLAYLLYKSLQLPPFFQWTEFLTYDDSCQQQKHPVV